MYVYHTLLTSVNVDKVLKDFLTVSFPILNTRRPNLTLQKRVNGQPRLNIHINDPYLAHPLPYEYFYCFKSDSFL